MSLRTTPAHKALSLNRDSVLRLLRLMSALLGWVIALGVAGVILLHNLYGQWQLTRQSQISISLLPDTPPAEVQALLTLLRQNNSVIHVEQLPEAEVREALSTLLDGDITFPLPVVLDATLTPSADAATLEQLATVVRDTAPTAEIDDARQLLATVGQGVRLVQWGVAGLALLMAGMMALLVALTVRTGLAGQMFTLSILKFLGGTDDFLAKLVVHQVLVHSLWGWAFGVVAAAAVLGGAMLLYAPLAALVNMYVWLGLVCGPLVLPCMTYLSALFTAHRTLGKTS
ncbi:MAG: hypothetical protein WAX89_05385 [Alphaproteobacteria bacterium]